MSTAHLKNILAAPLTAVFRLTSRAREFFRRLQSFAGLRASLRYPVPASVVVLGPIHIFGSGRIRCGEDLLLYPELHLETQGDAEILLGPGVVLSRGVHLVAMAGLRIGAGTMIGEYTSVRDANHARAPGSSVRNAGHTAQPIMIGSEVWIGRGVAVLAGVTIGDGATIGANAVVTRDVAPGSVVAGVPALPLMRRHGSQMSAVSSPEENCRIPR